MWYRLLKDEFGPDFWPAVAANEPMIMEQTGQVLDNVLSGQCAFGWMFGYNSLTALNENPDIPLKSTWVPPTALGYAANCILKEAANPQAAIIAYDWLASREGQQAIVNANRCLTARDDVDLGPNRVKLSEITWVPLDLEQFAAEEEALKAEWREVFGRE
jgi:ABC-type Fe3+ transport system substrate-binding protein